MTRNTSTNVKSPQWCKYYKAWNQRNPACVKRYRQKNLLRKYDPRLQSPQCREREYWALRQQFEMNNDDLSAVIFPSINDLVIAELLSTS